MRFFQYALVACFIVCVITDEDGEDGEEDESSERRNSDEKRTRSRGRMSNTSREKPTVRRNHENNNGDNSQEDEDKKRSTRRNQSESAENTKRNRESEESSGRASQMHGVNEGDKNGAVTERPPSRLSPGRGKVIGIDWARLTPRCYFKPEEGNCAGLHSLKRWYFDSDSQTCKAFSFPVCKKKAGAFLSCKLCMGMCLKTKRGKDKARWIRKVCGTKL
uniref:Anticoagulant protein rhipilin 1 n=1 Tax=Rhipicephalus zambeziensis TaxID=60191 RepID=A0A224Y1J4_9ACAR